MRKYYKLNVNSILNINNEDCLKYLYFYKLDNNTFVEKFTNQKIAFGNEMTISFNGIDLSIYDFIPSSSEEILKKYNEIRNKKLNLLYFSIIDLVFNNNNFNKKHELKRY